MDCGDRVPLPELVTAHRAMPVSALTAEARRMAEKDSVPETGANEPSCRKQHTGDKQSGNYPSHPSYPRIADMAHSGRSLDDQSACRRGVSREHGRGKHGIDGASGRITRHCAPCQGAICRHSWTTILCGRWVYSRELAQIQDVKARATYTPARQGRMP
jgi:hypothetical protein